MNDDRVSELYRGELSSERNQRVHRDRIHWIVSQARGRVLDIGCSQGIVSILMARAGHDVTGVEIEEPAIAYARTALAEEPADVQRRVRFVHADIHTALTGEAFDTVVLGEILEHHEAPRALWLRAARMLAPNGRLVGSTPFGLHPHPDHKTTFFLRNFLATIEGVGALAFLDVVDGYIRFVVDTAASTVSIDLGAEAVLARTESAFLPIQLAAEEAHRDRQERLGRKQAELVEAKARIKELAQSLDRATAQLTTARAEASDLRGDLLQVRQRLVDLERFTLPPEDASPRMRGLSAFLGSLQREVNTGGLSSSPMQALRKTYARIRRAVRGDQLSSGVE